MIPRLNLLRWAVLAMIAAALGAYFIFYVS